MPVIMRLAADGECLSTRALMSPGYAGLHPWNDLRTAGAVGYRYVAGYAGCKMSKLLGPHAGSGRRLFFTGGIANNAQPPATSGNPFRDQRQLCWALCTRLWGVALGNRQ